MEARRISKYLTATIKDYFKDREILVDRDARLKMGAGVPQGSVLGPTLWNILYDDVMDIDVQEGVTIICYADDLAITIAADSKTALRDKANEALYETSLWMRRNRLALAPEKTQAILLGRYRRTEGVSFEMEEHVIIPTKTVEYLGVTIDQGLSYGEHVKRVVGKASRTAKAIGAMLPNTKGPAYQKRRVLYGAVESIALYAAPIWSNGMRIAKYKGLMTKLQRQMTVRICGAYRTVSAEALAVIAGTIPIHLLVKERTRIFGRGMNAAERRQERERTKMEWQEEWEAETKAAWTRRVIRDNAPWVNRRKGQINYHVCQCLTGHGCFMRYLNRIGKRNDAGCMYCEAEDDVEHTLFACPRWERQRMAMNIEVGLVVTTENMAETMLTNAQGWKAVEKYMVEVIGEKEKYERTGG